MSKSRLVKCADCGGSFWQPIESRADPYPDSCPLCDNQDDVVLTMPKGALHPNIAKMVEEGRGPATSMLKAQSGDSVYRGMERASEARAQMAADHLGVNASEMNHMKITDLRDNLRPGDVAAKIPSAPVPPGGIHNAGFHGKPETMTGVPIAPGSMGNVGIGVHKTMIASGHMRRQAAVTRAGEQGRYKGQ